MRVSDIMTAAAVVDSADDSLAKAAAKMREQQTGSLLIMDGDRLLGIFTERDLLKSVALGRDPTETRLKDTMTTNVVTVSPETTLKEAATLMGNKWIRHLPVLKGEKVVGVISQRDLAGVLSDLLLDEPEQAPEDATLVRTQRLKRIEAGDLD